MRQRFACALLDFTGATFNTEAEGVAARDAAAAHLAANPSHRLNVELVN